MYDSSEKQVGNLNDNTLKNNDLSLFSIGILLPRQPMAQQKLGAKADFFYKKRPDGLSAVGAFRFAAQSRLNLCKTSTSKVLWP
jgi:hypothetical protein